MIRPTTNNNPQRIMLSNNQFVQVRAIPDNLSVIFSKCTNNENEMDARELVSALNEVFKSGGKKYVA